MAARRANLAALAFARDRSVRAATRYDVTAHAGELAERYGFLRARAGRRRRGVAASPGGVMSLRRGKTSSPISPTAPAAFSSTSRKKELGRRRFARLEVARPRRFRRRARLRVSHEDGRADAARHVVRGADAKALRAAARQVARPGRHREALSPALRRSDRQPARARRVHAAQPDRSRRCAASSTRRVSTSARRRRC